MALINYKFRHIVLKCKIASPAYFVENLEPELFHLLRFDASQYCRLNRERPASATSDCKLLVQQLSKLTERIALVEDAFQRHVLNGNNDEEDAPLALYSVRTIFGTHGTCVDTTWDLFDNCKFSMDTEPSATRMNVGKDLRKAAAKLACEVNNSFG